MSTRDDILARVRTAVAGSRQVDEPSAPSDPLAESSADPQAAADAIAERFVERITDYRAGIDRIGPAEIASAIASACRRHDITSLLICGGVPDDWLTDLGTVHVQAIEDAPSLSAADLDAIDGLLSGCAVAVAETGTIVLDGSAAQGRRVASLVPDVHLCVVTESQLVASVPQAVARLSPERPLTWISGGSATSDIELDRVEGVHGPRTLQVLFVR